jgi:hypothetical protein
MSKVLLALGGYALFVIAVFFGIGTSLDLQEAERRAADAATARAIWQARYAESSTDVKVKTVHVTKWATRYDTVRAAMDSVITDTVTMVPTDWVRQLVTVSDSTIAACRDLVSSCERFRTAADSTISAVSLERDLYQNLYKAAKPSRLQKALPWIAGAAGFYAGAKLRVP